MQRASLFNLSAYKNLVIENLKIKTTKNEEAKHIVVSRPPKRKSLERQPSNQSQRKSREVFFFSCCNLECRHLILRRVTQLVRRRQGVFQLRHFTTMGKTIHNLTLNRENSNKNFGFRIIGGKDEGQTFKVSIGNFLLGHTVIFILGGKSIDGIPSLLCWNEGPRLSDQREWPRNF